MKRNTYLTLLPPDEARANWFSCLAAKAFALGEADWPTRLRVEQDAAQAERQLARARIEAAAALSALRQALGLLPQ